MREGGLKQNEREVAMSDVGGGGSCFVEERKRESRIDVDRRKCVWGGEVVWMKEAEKQNIEGVLHEWRRANREERKKMALRVRQQWGVKKDADEL